MKISVILTTARYGGFDMLQHSIERQTMPREDFELIIVDELFEKRKYWLDSLPPDMNAKHIPPWKKFDIYDNSTGWNTGLRVAQGELICFLIDFMWLPPTYLENHWNFYKAHPGWSMTGYLDRYAFPPLREDIDNGLWSIFKQEFDAKFAEKWFDENEPVYQERKGGTGKIIGWATNKSPLIEMPWDKVYMIPDSIPLAILKELNGWDELYNGGYGSNDIDLAFRATKLEHRFGMQPVVVAQKLGTPELSAKIPGIKKPMPKTPEENYKLCMDRIDAINEGRETLAVPEGRGAWR